eukprot:COSAG06_NODE_24460_length_662_cov_0.730018_2_plen_117_part_00
MCVELSLCLAAAQIMDLFELLSEITLDPNCRAGCEEGHCPDMWYPGAHDICSAECGRVYEPFWDECGECVRPCSAVVLRRPASENAPAHGRCNHLTVRHLHVCVLYTAPLHPHRHE